MQKANCQHFLSDAKLCKKHHHNQNGFLVNIEISLKRNSHDLIKSPSAEKMLMDKVLTVQWSRMLSPG